jgi:nanoRNase/pAp phosphatase (c-di-AMP/oligoRNAs hydrolase)
VTLPTALPPQPFQASLARLLAALDGARKILICTHDNPDPDSIAAGYALCRLLEVHLGATCVLAHGGVLGRAENRTMVELLRIPLVPFAELNADDFDAFGLVDTQPVHHNHVLQPSVVNGRPLFCLDHHPVVPGPILAWADIGGRYGSTSTLATCYLQVAEVPLDGSLATALFYGIKSDTRDLGREVHDVDVWAYAMLVPRTDMSVVSRIEHPVQPRQHFATLARAFQNTQVYGQVAMVDLGAVYIPDVIAECADALQAAEGVHWAIAVGEHGDHIYASVRVNQGNGSAGTLVITAIRSFDNGNAGGHDSMAGCRLRMATGTSTAERSKQRQLLRDALLRAANVHDHRPVPLCPP